MCEEGYRLHKVLNEGGTIYLYICKYVFSIFIIIIIFNLRLEFKKKKKR